MEKLLSDIDLSRSVLVATFLELEASVRSGRCLDNASYYIYIYIYIYIYMKMMFEATCADIQKCSLDNPWASLVC